jgi:hypothetical protein
MTTTFPRVDTTTPLDTPRQERQANITIEGTLDGLAVSIEFTAAISAIPAAIERLKAIGMSGAQRTMTPVAKPKAETVEPMYQPNGTPCCPVHKRELSEGQYGLYCSAKAKPGEAANGKGYCSLRFAE